MPTTQNLAPAGYLSVLGIATEVTAGTAVAPSLYVPFTAGVFQADNKIIKRNTARKTKGSAFPGSTCDVTGSIDIEASPDESGLLIALALGKDTVVTASGASTHTFTLAPLSTFTASCDYGKNTVFEYVNNKIDKFTIDIKQDAPLAMKFTSIGVNVSPLATTSLVPTFSSPVSGGLPFDYTMITSCTLAGVPLNPETLSIAYSNALKTYQSAGSGRFVRSINELASDVSGTFTRAYEDDLITELIWGSNSGPSTSLVGAAPLVITFTSPANVTGGSVPYSMTITLPNIILESAPVAPTRTAITMQSVKFSGFSSTAAIINPTTVPPDDLKIELVNSNPTAYV